MKKILILYLCLFFYGCDTSQDSYLSKNQENATTSLVNPFYKMLDIAIKLSFIPQEKDILQDNAHFLATITTQDSQTLWQDALRVPLDKEYSKWQTLENEAKTYQQRQEYHTKRMQGVRDMSFAYGLYALKISMDFTQNFIDSPADATKFCQAFDTTFNDEKMWYAMGVMGLDGAYLEPLDNPSLEKWILQDEALRTLYGLIRTYQKPIIESYRQRCENHSQKSQLQDSFKSLESRFNDPLPIIASIVLKIDAIPNIDKVLESQEFQDTSIVSKYRELYAEYHTMLDSVKNDDWNAPLRIDAIKAISAYLLNLNAQILAQDSLCQSFEAAYRVSKNLEALRILDNSILDEASAKKSLSQREANLELIANNKELGILMVHLAKSFNDLVLEKHQKQCKG